MMFRPDITGHQGLTIATNKRNLQYLVSSRVKPSSLNVKAHNPIARELA